MAASKRLSGEQAVAMRRIQLGEDPTIASTAMPIWEANFKTMASLYERRLIIATAAGGGLELTPFGTEILQRAYENDTIRFHTCIGRDSFTGHPCSNFVKYDTNMCDEHVQAQYEDILVSVSDCCGRETYFTESSVFDALRAAEKRGKNAQSK